MARSTPPRRGAQVSSRNRITIPSDVLRAAGIAAGDAIRVEVEGPGVIRVRRAENALDAAAGALTGVFAPGHVDRLRSEWADTMAVMDTAPERDWVTDEAEALLAADPELRASIERQMAEHRAGTLSTVDTSTVRRMLDERAPRRKRGQPT